MSKTLIVLLGLICTLSAFIIVQNKENNVQGINWPFTTCGNGDWTIEKLGYFGETNNVVILPEKNDKLLTDKQQSTYCSGVGILVWLMKHF